MHIHAYRLKNYRRFKDAVIELGNDISIFVGSNNSGKTSATQAINAFVAGQKERFSIYDFSAACWAELDAVGETALAADGYGEIKLPSIELDLWLEVAASDLYLVLPLLPSTSWKGTKVGIRVAFAPRLDADVIRHYQEAKSQSDELTKDFPPGSDYQPWPRSLTDYLQKELRNEYELRYYVLDRSQFDDDLHDILGYSPSQLTSDPGGAAILRSLIQIDNLSAQRHLADANTEGGVGRAEDLSKKLSKFYKRNLDQRQDDHRALKALSDSENALNLHLDKVFGPTLERLSKLGYPGVNNPRLRIMSALDPAHVMNQDARVHYVLGEGANASTLPDSYNGLGFKNLIYMVVEILDAQARWANLEDRPPLHLIFIEEPEAHLHAQLQQVFIRNILELLKIETDDSGVFASQLVVTSHSPHILYERGFKPIRYFRKQKNGTEQITKVLNLSKFYQSQPNDRDFLERYLKLTHCDLFFADAAILVEGNVERLLLPLMIEKVAKNLRSSCLCILEVGGAFGHRFKTLIEFLGLTTLIITDIDSVGPTVSVTAVTPGLAATEDDDDVEEFEVPLTMAESLELQATRADSEQEAKPKTKKKKGKACLPSVADAVTSNQTLISWLPGYQTIIELEGAGDVAKTAELEDGAKVRVAYQISRPVTWNGDTVNLYGRTLEEDFGLENPIWSQHPSRKDVGLVISGITEGGPADLAAGLHRKVSSKSFDKTKFALGVMTEHISSWDVPAYIRDGLVWLKQQIAVEADEPLLATAAEEIEGLAQ